MKRDNSGLLMVLRALMLPATLLLAGCGARIMGPADPYDFGATFVTIPSGSFVMGSPDSEPGRDSDEGPQHTVYISSFQLMTTEVTQGMWEEVMGSNPASDYGVGSSYPVYNVPWDDCQGFINQLNSLDTEYEYRLPSEAEWEYACRAGTTTRFYWGDDLSYSLIGQYAWYVENWGLTTHPVAQKIPNAWGLYDMSGNVWECCEDGYHDSYSGAPTDGSAWLSPAGSDRVFRSAGLYGPPQQCRSAGRNDTDPYTGFRILGLRLARSVL